MLHYIVQVHKLHENQTMYPLNNKDFFPDKFSEQNKPDVSLGFIFYHDFKRLIRLTGLRFIMKNI